MEMVVAIIRPEKLEEVQAPVQWRPQIPNEARPLEEADHQGQRHP